MTSNGCSICKIKLAMENKKFTVEITKDGAMKAQPAIWYCEHPMKQFVVEKSKQWKGVYQVVEGKYKGMIIDTTACRIVGA